MSQEATENRYMQETGLFPPGRDIPASRGEPDINEYRAAAFRYWRVADSYTWWATAADLVNTYLRELGADDDQIKHPQELPAAIERLVFFARNREARELRRKAITALREATNSLASSDLAGVAMAAEAIRRGR